jgi:polar amino acid transport system substrate-binding protein
MVRLLLLLGDESKTDDPGKPVNSLKKLLSLLISSLFIWVVITPVSLYAQSTLTFSSIDNPLNIEVERAILHRAYQRLGIEVSLLPMPAKRALRSANTGMTDGEAARVTAIEQEYPNLIRVDVPIRVLPMHLYVRAGAEFSVNGWDSIPDDYVIGQRRGIKFAEYAISKHHLKSITNSDEKGLLEQLSKGLIEIVVAHPAVAEKWIEELQLQDIVRLDPPIHVSYLYHYLHRKHAHLVPEISRVLQEMERSGLIQEINNQFVSGRK